MGNLFSKDIDEKPFFCFTCGKLLDAYVARIKSSMSRGPQFHYFCEWHCHSLYLQRRIIHHEE